MGSTQLANDEAKTVDEIPARNAETELEVSALIDAAADHHRAIQSVSEGSLVTNHGDGVISGYVKLKDTTSYAAGQATKLLRAMGATVDRTPGATRNGRVWFEIRTFEETDTQPPTERGCNACGASEEKQVIIAEPAKQSPVEMSLPDAVLKCTSCGHEWEA